MFRHPALVGVMMAVLASNSTIADVVLDWNATASDVLVADQTYQNPGMASRTMAMVNIAIHDALAASGVGSGTFYSYHSLPSTQSSLANATAATAAHTVLSSIYSGQQGSLDAALDQALAGHSMADRSTAMAAGQAIGQTVIANRANDGFNTNVQYQPTGAVGHWQPDPINSSQQAWGPNWGDVQTFCLPSVEPFLPAAPPAITSQQYASAFNEVKSLGSVNSSERTQEQTDIGKFWAYDRLGMGTPMRLYNQALRNIAESQINPEARINNVSENADLFAKATVAMADAGIVAWNAKFEHDLWRPVTGIREADQDGNADTVADPNWTPLGAPEINGPNFTPPFPTYISGHATFGGALFTTIAEFYDTDEVTFSLESDELPGMIRTFDRLSDAMAENGRSRVYLGIHWNYDDTVGQTTGANIAQFITSQPFTAAAVPEPSGFAVLLVIAIHAARRRRR
ncbi:PAP2 superfamily protein [Crateriforma conspicua]|uniref:PAP2 superfamily protein n=1 Tax=Crateriforma conspicua TaxID=2527996 RepID=A0A5C6FTG1_9PLAN|nr:vanadium-dependent haloperoxidase [Crateriforma conspicua]TWU64463.1 PAP2 superfamily protein [Crateriforma conspicua]